MGTTDITLERIFRQLAEGNAGKAMAETDTYLSAWPNPQSRERLEELKAEYRLMEDYWMQGADDPQRGEQYQRLLQRLYVLCANIAIHRHISASAFLQGLCQQARQPGRSWSLDAIRRGLEGFVTDVAMLQLEPEHQRASKSQEIYKQHQQLMNALFNYIVTSRVWTEGVGQDMEELLLSPTVDTIDQQLIVAAITLSLMNRFDMVKFRLLMNVGRLSCDEDVRQRALVGWVMGIDDDFYDIYPEQQQLVDSLLKSEKACLELTELQMQLVYALNAERDTTTIRQEIMPDLMNNNQFRVTPNGVEEVEEDELEDALHPDAAEKRMEKLEASIGRMMDMQKQGADIYFGGFSQMKRFPFFYDMSNWLVPFYLQHPDIAQFVQRMDDNKFVSQMAQHAPFCNSDRYSFLIGMQQTIGSLPAKIVEMMRHSEARLEEIMPQEPHDAAYVRRLYLMDLYRFFKLFPNRSVFCNPFDTSKDEMGMCLFFTSRLFADTPLKAHMHEVAAMLLKHGLKDSAHCLIDRFPEDIRDVQYYVWKEDYDTALQLAPDNAQVLAGAARTAFAAGRFKDALDCYDRLLLVRPEKKGYRLNKAICLLKMREYNEALQLLYQLNYEQPEDVRVSSALAWGMLCSGKPEQAARVYDELDRRKQLSAEDCQNRGYSLWVQGHIAEAADCFRKYLASDGRQESQMPWDHTLLEAYGITPLDVKMMEALTAR